MRNEVLSGTWAAHTRLFMADDGADWVLAQEMREVGAIARRLGIDVGSTRLASGVHDQSVFYASQFVLLEPRHFGQNRVGIAYFHGRVTDEPNFALCFERLRAEHSRISRVQVSHSAMRDFVLSSGIDRGKVFQIPIGVNLRYFPLRTPELRRAARTRYGIPESAVVVGSFQKDGVGWGAGDEPKLIKGPDVFIRTIAALHRRIPDLFVMLSGPARGYVKTALARAGIPFLHRYIDAYEDVGRLFQALDLYLVTSREEGGPKAVLEAMASGVPLVTTRVGQATDLVRHGVNAWIVDVDDEEALLHWATRALEDGALTESVLSEARRTAEANAYERQDALWRALFDGFVSWG